MFGFPPRPVSPHDDGSLSDALVDAAAEDGDLAEVKRLEQQGAIINATNNHGDTPLHLASLMGHLDVVRYLVEQQGAKVNATDKDANTPLHNASLNGHLDVVQYLTREAPETNRARLDVTNKEGRTPLEEARHKDKKSIVRFLEKLAKEQAAIVSKPMPPPQTSVRERLVRLGEVLGVETGTGAIQEKLRTLEIAFDGDSKEGSVIKRLNDLEKALYE